MQASWKWVVLGCILLLGALSPFATSGWAGDDDTVENTLTQDGVMPPESRDQKSLRQRRLALESAYRRHDAKAILRFYHPSYAYFTEGPDAPEGNLSAHRAWVLRSCKRTGPGRSYPRYDPTSHPLLTALSVGQVSSTLRGAWVEAAKGKGRILYERHATARENGREIQYRTRITERWVKVRGVWQIVELKATPEMRQGNGEWINVW